jgi:hypothetical protein
MIVFDQLWHSLQGGVIVGSGRDVSNLASSLFKWHAVGVHAGIVL